LDLGNQDLDVVAEEMPQVGAFLVGVHLEEEEEVNHQGLDHPQSVTLWGSWDLALVAFLALEEGQEVGHLQVDGGQQAAHPSGNQCRGQHRPVKKNPLDQEVCLGVQVTREVRFVVACPGQVRP